MKVLQLIDTLNPGGAEKMALNYWKTLKSRSESSILVVTREKGLWGKEIHDTPGFYFLEKKNTFDLKALGKLKKIIKENEISIVQAHGTSWFFAVLCKLSGSDFKLIWHDHYGNSEFLERRPSIALKIFSGYFDGIISVNNALKDWAVEKLHYKKDIIFMPNFVIDENNSNIKTLKGETDYKIVCVANLRSQKDHLNLLRAFDLLQNEFSVSLHLFGRDYGDAYSDILKLEFGKREEVYYYGEVSDATAFLKDADVGVLSSESEGLPLALIEYGIAGLPVVCTDAGESREVANGSAKLVKPGDPNALAKSIHSYLLNPRKMKYDCKALQKRIIELYSEERVVEQYLNFISNIEKR